MIRLAGSQNVICGSSTRRGEGWLPLDLGDVGASADSIRELLQRGEISAVYCLGGATHAERCQDEPEWAMRLNSTGPAQLAGLCRDIPFVYFSSEYVFDGHSGPYVETDPVTPLSAYGRSKAEGEKRVMESHPAPLIVRTTVVYGPDVREKNFLYAMHRVLGAGEDFPVPFDQLSSPTYNLDLAAASLALVDKGASGIFHVAGPEVMSRYDFAIRAARMLGYDTGRILRADSQHVGQHAPRPSHAGLRIEKLRSVCPELKMHTLEESFEHWLQTGGRCGL